MSLEYYIRQVHAAQNFKIHDDFSIVSFDDITEQVDIENGSDKSIVQDLEIWASIEIQYDGIIPKSYKVLNLIIGDWVTSHQKEITPILHKQLKEFLSKQFPDSDNSELEDEAIDTSIFLDQLDYMPRVNEKNRTIVIEVELVLEAEQQDDI
jgi:NDP-sugar pyrophosphorylase family protein